MRSDSSVLLVHDYEYPLSDLWAPLKRLGFQRRRARSCAEASLALALAQPPVLLFTDTDLPDGGWAQTVALAAGARPPVPVIVVAKVVETCLYLDAIESGATEFIVPPFRESDVRYVVQGALMAGSRRSSAVRRARASLIAVAPP
jgi:two-component system, chemotaxis family, chemotaxis protein CheY